MVLLLVVDAIQVRFMCVVGLLGVAVLLTYALSLPGSHIMTNAALADL